MNLVYKEHKENTLQVLRCDLALSRVKLLDTVRQDPQVFFLGYGNVDTKYTQTEQILSGPRRSLRVNLASEVFMLTYPASLHYGRSSSTA